MSPALAGGFLSTVPPGKFSSVFMRESIHSSKKQEGAWEGGVSAVVL